MFEARTASAESMSLKKSQKTLPCRAGIADNPAIKFASASAAYQDILARNPSAGWRKQKNCQVGHVFRLACIAQG